MKLILRSALGVLAFAFVLSLVACASAAPPPPPVNPDVSRTLYFQNGPDGRDVDLFVAYFDPTDTPYATMGSSLKILGYLVDNEPVRYLVTKLETQIQIIATGKEGVSQGQSIVEALPGGDGGNGGNIRVFYPKDQTPLRNLKISNTGGKGGRGGKHVEMRQGASIGRVPQNTFVVLETGPTGNAGQRGTVNYLSMEVRLMQDQGVFEGLRVTDKPLVSTEAVTP